jgi:hypothetical protein
MANKTKPRLAFNFLRSYYDVLEDIHRDEDKLTYLMAILDKQFKGIEPELIGIPRLCYNGQKHSIDKSVEGWESKTKQKLYDPTKGGYEGGSQDPTEDPYQDPTEWSYQHPSGDIVMTTEDPTEGSYLQEQEQEKEKEQEEVEEQISNNNKFINYAILDSDLSLKNFYVENKNDIEFLITQGYTLEQSLSIQEDAIKCSIFK